MAETRTLPARPRIGLVLGSGSARGWAHIGAIRALEDAGIRPDIVCGASIGALVGAAYVAGELDRLETWVRSLKMQTVVSFLDFSLGGGLIKGEKLIDFFRAHFVDRDIRELERPYGAVATDLARGREIWLREGGVSDAVRASIALPGLFTPVAQNGAWLVDGGLVNPVPVSLARAMGADFIIAVDLNADLLGRRPDVVIGKPNQPIVDAVAQKLALEPGQICMVGDRLYTDIALGKAGVLTILVLSGETRREDLASSPFQPDLIMADLAELTAVLQSAG